MNYSKKEQPCEGKVLEEEEKNDIESENVDVVAPATLVAGFEFEAVYQGETFIVKVPPAGVTKGKIFQAPFANPPRYTWEYSLRRCCTFGCYHPTYLMACFCSPLLLAQVMTRMRLNWYASPATVEQEGNTFECMLISWVVILFIFYLAYPAPVSEDEFGGAGFVYLYPVIAIYCIFTILVLAKTRYTARKRYNIRPKYHYCNGLMEDVCCSLCCNLCTISQLAKETTDYNTIPEAWLSNTGLAIPIHSAGVVKIPVQLNIV